MYSLGVILCEMFSKPTTTQSERIQNLTKIKNTKEFSISMGIPLEIQSLIVKLLDKDPKKRPSALELLSSDYIPQRIQTAMGSSNIINLKETIKTITDPTVYLFLIKFYALIFI